jgi:hypothetical protein
VATGVVGVATGVVGVAVGVVVVAVAVGVVVTGVGDGYVWALAEPPANTSPTVSRQMANRDTTPTTAIR